MQCPCMQFVCHIVQMYHVMCTCDVLIKAYVGWDILNDHTVYVISSLKCTGMVIPQEMFTNSITKMYVYKSLYVARFF